MPETIAVIVPPAPAACTRCGRPLALSPAKLVELARMGVAPTCAAPYGCSLILTRTNKPQPKGQKQ